MSSSIKVISVSNLAPMQTHEDILWNEQFHAVSWRQLCVFPQDAFWGLVQICEKYLPGYYSPGLVRLKHMTSPGVWNADRRLFYRTLDVHRTVIQVYSLGFHCDYTNRSRLLLLQTELWCSDLLTSKWGVFRPWVNSGFISCPTVWVNYLMRLVLLLIVAFFGWFYSFLTETWLKMFPKLKQQTATWCNWSGLFLLD